jgi:hypothetical protein
MATSRLPILLPQPLHPRPLHGLVLFTGHESVLPLGQLLSLEYLGRGDPVVLVDGANAFNPYLLADAARAQGLDLRHVLDAVRLSRVYTCHQLETLWSERLRPAIASFRPGAILCLGLLDPLYDEDVPATEAARIFRRLALAIRDAAAHLPILAACPDPAVPDRSTGDLRWMFGEKLREMAGWHFTAQPENGRMWISRERPDPARWEWTLALPGRTFRRRT